MIKRKYSLILGILFAIVSISKFLSGDITNPKDDLMYNLGSILGAIVLPGFFLVMAFLPEKKK